MSPVEKIEAQIAKLSSKDVARLTKWLVEYDAALWDKQIEQDAKSGRLRQTRGRGQGRLSRRPNTPPAVNSRANARFWQAYRQLPPTLRTLARKNYRLWRQNPRHPSLRFKKVGDQP